MICLECDKCVTQINNMFSKCYDCNVEYFYNNNEVVYIFYVFDGFFVEYNYIKKFYQIYIPFVQNKPVFSKYPSKKEAENIGNKFKQIMILK